MFTTITPEPPSTIFQDPQITQPAIVFLQIALFSVLKTQYGIVPDVIVAHSIGEVAAAYACGAVTLADAVLIVAKRSFFQSSVPADIQHKNINYIKIIYIIYLFIFI